MVNLRIVISGGAIKIWWDSFESWQRHGRNEGTWHFQELTLLRKTKWGGRLRGFCFLTMREKSTHLILHPEGDDLKLDECTGMSPGDTEHGCCLMWADTMGKHRSRETGGGWLGELASVLFQWLPLSGLNGKQYLEWELKTEDTVEVWEVAEKVWNGGLEMSGQWTGIRMV